MNKEIATRWVDALRSGAYKQGRGSLKEEVAGSGVEHCCLGVLCELWAADTGEKWEEGGGGDEDDSMFSIDGETLLLPDAVRKWAGMLTANGTVCPQCQSHIGQGNPPLTELNDGGRTFLEIADHIERNVEAL